MSEFTENKRIDPDEARRLLQPAPGDTVRPVSREIVQRIAEAIEKGEWGLIEVKFDEESICGTGPVAPVAPAGEQHRDNVWELLFPGKKED